MPIYEITGFLTGTNKSGVNYLQPKDSYQNIVNGFIDRQVLQSRQGASRFCPRLVGGVRVFGIFEHTLPDSTKELLAIDQNQFYKYNTGTGIFDPIPFGGSLALTVPNTYSGFGITAKDFYISGTSYPAAQFKSDGMPNPAYGSNGGARFIFTGQGINPLFPDNTPLDSTIFVYDGTDIKCFTNTTDNPNYAPPVEGALTSAEFVLWFNERLNFFIPTMNGVEYNQGILYSGIRTIIGAGDKYNVPGAGLLQADTYENMTGVTILGQILSLKFDRSDWTLEKTSDVFNPWFIRKVPSVIGTNAKFSPVSWFDKSASLGRTAIINSDGREQLRIDNKNPYFTTDEIDQIGFNLTYGGFDRVNSQFLWSYKISETDSDTQNSVLVRNYEEDSWSVYDQRFSVFGQTDLGLNLTWDDIDETAGNESWAQWDTTEEIWDRIGLGLAVQKTLAGDDKGFIYQLNQDYDDYFTDITDITQAPQAVLTIPPSAFLVGDLVTVSNVADMTEINNYDESIVPINYTPYTVMSATDTSVTLNVDSQAFTAYMTDVSGGTLSKVITFSAETIPFNPWREVGMRCYISHVEFLLDTNGGNLKVDVFADEQETPYKRDIIIFPTITTQAREWITMTVDCEANFHTIVMKQQSPSVQMRLTSMRIHCSPAGYTSG